MEILDNLQIIQMEQNPLLQSSLYVHSSSSLSFLIHTYLDLFDYFSELIALPHNS